jgi:hypothetical protein
MQVGDTDRDSRALRSAACFGSLSIRLWISTRLLFTVPPVVP